MKWTKLPAGWQTEQQKHILWWSTASSPLCSDLVQLKRCNSVCSAPRRKRIRNGIISPASERTASAELQLHLHICAEPTVLSRRLCLAPDVRAELKSGIGAQQGESWHSHWHHSSESPGAPAVAGLSPALLFRLSCFLVQMVEIKIVIAGH